jgi:hypothetical protein
MRSSGDTTLNHNVLYGLTLVELRTTFKSVQRNGIQTKFNAKKYIANGGIKKKQL